MTAIAAEYRPTLGMSVVGGLLSADLLERLRRGDRELGGIRPEDYGLAARETLGEAASREWEYLTGAYRAFRDRIGAIDGEQPLIEETRRYWLMILLQRLGFGRVPVTQGGFDVEGRHYPISHVWESTPIHLLGWNVDLDKVARGVAGAARRAPQSMMQDFLNSSSAHLWGILSNGRVLRVLRDSTQLVGASYLEFDLEAIFEGELYADFVPLFTLAHSSRFEAPVPEDGTEPNVYACWLERWRAEGIASGERAREKLRENLKDAIERLGTGFVAANPHVAAALQDGRLGRDDFRQELLRLAYQLIFCFVTEDRGVLLDSGAPAEARERYETYFSTRRLRRVATRRVGDRHVDLWRTMVIVLNSLGADDGHAALALPGLGGLFFCPDPRPGYAREAVGESGAWRPYPDFLRDCDLRNDALLGAVRALATFRNPRSGRLDTVDFQHLGAEELGSVYESLLELHGDVESDGSFVLRDVAGNQRKTTGSYYTPDPLIQNLLDTALDPVIEQYAKSHTPADLLEITVCDPACGSGHFLVAAARRIAKRYAQMADGDGEPTPAAVRDAMREVVTHCVYGVDLNPLAAELAKVSLWLESVVPGKPLAFLDAHIKVGNSLLGVTPKLLAEGIPDGAFKPLGDDDRKLVAKAKKENKVARDSGKQTLIFEDDVIHVGNHRLRKAASEITELPVRGLPDVREQIRRHRDLSNSPHKRHKKMIADAWCAAFVWPIREGAPEPIKTDTLKQLDEGARLPEAARTELESITERYQFFHWHLEFPEIFVSGDDERSDTNPDTDWRGGFACVLGNPPWDRVKLQEKEFFASRDEEIATAANAAKRKKLIADLADSDETAKRALYAEFQTELRKADGQSVLLRDSGIYPWTGRGDINTYALFAEAARCVLGGDGRSGLIVPTNIATDATTAPFFGHLVDTESLVNLFDFINDRGYFPGVGHGRQRFCLFVTSGRQVRSKEIRISFARHDADDLRQEDAILQVTPEIIAELNPNTKTCPIFESARDANLTLEIYRRAPVLRRKVEPERNPWNLSFATMFHMANDSQLFKMADELRQDGWNWRGNIFEREGECMVPLYEAKMFHHFDHRYGDYSLREPGSQDSELPRPDHASRSNPSYVIQPNYWISRDEVEKASKGNDWQLAFRKICRSTDERTSIVSAVPLIGIGDSANIIFTDDRRQYLYATFTTFVFDYVLRQKLAGTNLNFFQFEQLPVFPPDFFTLKSPMIGLPVGEWIDSRMLELVFTAWDMESFARYLDDSGPPFVWDDERRFLVRCELDAAFFHLYGIERDDVDYIMETFPIVKRKDEQAYGEYRTKRQILEIYDAMAEAEATGKPYQTLLDPPPGQGPRHPADTRPDWLDD